MCGIGVKGWRHDTGTGNIPETLPDSGLRSGGWKRTLQDARIYGGFRTPKKGISYGGFRVWFALIMLSVLREHDVSRNTLSEYGSRS